MIAGQIALTAAAGALVWTLVWGFPWLPSTEPQRLAILGTSMTILLSIIALCFMAFGFAVSFQSLKATGPGGASITIEGEDDTECP
jgi:hypothetical protein